MPTNYVQVLLLGITVSRPKIDLGQGLSFKMMEITLLFLICLLGNFRLGVRDNCLSDLLLVWCQCSWKEGLSLQERRVSFVICLFFACTSVISTVFSPQIPHRSLLKPSIHFQRLDLMRSGQLQIQGPGKSRTTMHWNPSGRGAAVNPSMPWPPDPGQPRGQFVN